MATDPTTEVQAARDRLFAAFEPLGPPAAEDPTEVARLLMKAGTTWGRPGDVRRLVPAALSLAADNQLAIDRGLMWSKLRWAGWPDWPTYQTLTVREFLRAEWRRLIRSEPRPAHLAHRWLRDACADIDDLEGILDDWLDAMTEATPRPHRQAATGQLVALVLQSPFRPDVPKSLQDVFPRSPVASAQIRDWLASARTDEAVRAAAAAFADSPDRKRIALAVERLERFRGALDRDVRAAAES